MVLELIFWAAIMQLLERRSAESVKFTGCRWCRWWQQKWFGDVALGVTDDRHKAVALRLDWGRIAWLGRPSGF